MQLKNGWLEVMELVALFLFKMGTCDAKNSCEFFVDAIFCFVKICFQAFPKERDKYKVSLMNRSSLRWLDTVFKGQYLPSLSINYVAKNKVLEKLPPQLY